MKQKKIWLVMLAVTLAFGLVLVGCKTDGDDDDKGVKLPEVYQNTTWKNTSEDIGNQYTKIAFKTTSATLFRDNGPITDNTGTVFNVNEVGPNNQYTSQLNTDVSQISLTEYVKPVPGEGGDNVAAGPIVYIFVKDDGTGILVQNEESWESWVKQP
jgi:hypothetical protein